MDLKKEIHLPHVPYIEKDLSETLWQKNSSGIRVPGNFHVVRLPFQTDPLKILNIMNKLVKKDEWGIKDEIKSYYGIGLVGSDPLDVYGDDGKPRTIFGPGGRMIGKIPRPPRLYESELYQELDFFWKLFKDFRLFNSRMMMLRPGGIVPNHTDSPTAVNFHLAITTDPFSALAIKGNIYQIPADGRVYAVNASVDHSAFNFGLTDRTHLMFNLDPLEQ